MALLDEILQRLGQMPAEEKAELARAVAQVARKWAPNPGPQTQAYMSPADILLYGGQAGGGKGFRKTELVLTPFGWRELGRLKVGSAVCAPDGTVTKIIGYFERGRQPMYRLTLCDGSAVECDADHLWLAWEAGTSRKISNRLIGGRTSAKKWTTADMCEHYQNGGRKLAIPAMTAPAAFNVAGALVGPGDFVGRPVPPYVLGVLLGDGCITQRGDATFACADPEIAARVSADLDTTLSCYATDGRCAVYRLPRASTYGLDELALWGKGAGDKAIPKQYLLAPVRERWALLRGLMDTDGWAEEDGDTYFCSISSQLIADVAHLARSLGAIVFARQKEPTYTHNGEARNGQTAYTLRIKMPEPRRMFHLPRKRDRCVAKTSQNYGRWIEKIEPIGEADTVCITVEHRDSLFVVHDFIVTHNSHLELGWCVNEAEQGIIFRRERTQTDGLEKEGKRIIGQDASFNGQDLEWTWPSGKTLKLGGIQGPDDWNDHAGRERDAMLFDEAGEFLEGQVASLIFGWLRAAPGKRTRAILASNPPRTSDGLWLLKWFAPWLDDKFPNPAQEGELRWAVQVTRDGEISVVWVEGPGEYEVEGETYTAKSYTFIRASLEDNPYRNTPEYRASLQSLPEPLRSQLLKGDFLKGVQDQAMQCIPTEWVRLAQQRWRDRPPEGVPMCAIGVDCSGGGDDAMAQAPRYDGWFAPIVKTPGKSIPMEKAGSFAAGMVLSVRRDGAVIVVDMGGGYGGPLYEHLNDNDIECVGFRGAEACTRRYAAGKLKATNKRSAAYWGFREALDPGQPGGSPIALPPEPRLFAGLTAPTFEVTAQGIQVEPKVKYDKKGKIVGGVRAKLGFSPDEADAVVMAWFEGPRETTMAMEWAEMREQGRVRATGRSHHAPTVNHGGREPLSARRHS